MLKMIIADDEPVITKGIKKLIDWKQLGIEILDEYHDGRSALHGILSLNPDIALLDISMPYKSGIDIIKEVRALSLKTQVVFITGFQEFNYVKEALSQGAVEYLLKPIKKDELLKTIERCMMLCQNDQKSIMHNREEYAHSDSMLSQDFLNQLAETEETYYRVVIFEIMFDYTKSIQEEKLIRFSISSVIENYILDNEVGIFFTKDEKLVAIMKGMKLEEIKETYYILKEEIKKQTKNNIGIVISPEVSQMSQIPPAYEKCLKKMGYLFFETLMTIPIVVVNEPTFRRNYTPQQLVEYRKRTIDSLFNFDEQQWLAEFDQYAEIIGIVSDGNKEDAWFYFNATIRLIEEKLEAMNISTGNLNMNEILEKGRATRNYHEMAKLYKNLFHQSYQSIRDAMGQQDKKDIINAKDYINQHYQENISLEVMANYIHMNPYYFSSYFKKQTGENFKDYLNKVRMEHALRLLLSTDKKSYEIADEVGFKNEKYFSKLFQRYYGKTPTQYRKKG